MIWRNLHLLEHRAGNPVLGGEPIEPRHRALPSLERQERHRKTPDMAQQKPWPFPHRVAIRFPRTEDRAVERLRAGEQLGELGQARPKHRIDRIAMVRIAQGYRDKDEVRRSATGRGSGAPQRRVSCEPDFLDRGAENIAERDSVTHYAQL